jgi:hypothetical protein
MVFHNMIIIYEVLWCVLCQFSILEEYICISLNKLCDNSTLNDLKLYIVHIRKTNNNQF